MSDLVPPDGDKYWSIVTIARHLCVSPASVDTLLAEGDDESPDLLRARHGYGYRDANGEDLGDCYITEDAVERIAAALPVGLLARRVVADEPQMAALLGWDQIHALARHIVELADGGAR